MTALRGLAEPIAGETVPNQSPYCSQCSIAGVKVYLDWDFYLWSWARSSCGECHRARFLRLILCTFETVDAINYGGATHTRATDPYE
jgi:hypothetical protein